MNIFPLLKRFSALSVIIYSIVRPVISTSPGCDVLDDGFCYNLIHACKTYSNALSTCESAGASLASISNADLNSQLAEMIGEDTFFGPWIGLSDSIEEGTWVWADDSDVVYTNWDDGEPNSFGKGEDCAHLHGNGKWNDIGCESTLPFICKFDSSANYDGDTADTDTFNTADAGEECLTWDIEGDDVDDEWIWIVFYVSFVSSFLAGILVLLLFCCCVVIFRKFVMKRSNNQGPGFVEMPFM
mmetsp:Transcript_10437/g.13530  ORF Transcript_10437/g.13530 Transcript_10437/m.13530 type:complete len:242 (+) Transcript_10437:109-834(+)